MSESAMALSDASLWSAVWKLLRLQLVLFIGGFRRARTRRKVGTIILWIIILIVLVGAFVLSWFILRFVRSPELATYVDVGPFIASVPVMVVSAAFIGILLTSFGLLLQALYLAGDMDFLLSAPIPIRAVFISKMLQAILPNFSFIMLFGLPVLFGIGASGGYNFLYYPLVLIVMAAMALAAAGISSLLVMSIVRIVPARRIAEVLGFFGAIFSFLCSQSGNLMRWSDVDETQMATAANTLTRFDTPWSPLAWAGRGLVAIGEGHWLVGIGLTALTLILASGAFAVSLITAERLYYSGWASMQGNLRKKKPARAARPAGARRAALVTIVEQLIHPQVRAIIVKDYLVLRRDLRSMSQLVTPLILGIVYAFLLLRGGSEPPPGRGEAPQAFMDALGGIMSYANIGIALFVSWSLLARLAMMGFSHEGKNYWLLKTSPVTTTRLLVAKFTIAYLPSLILAWLFLVVMSLLQPGALAALPFGLAAVALIIAGADGINLAFGVSGANFDWNDPRKMMSGNAGCLGSLATIGYLLISMALFFGPPVVIALLKWPAIIGQIVGLVIGGAATLTCAIVPLWLVRKKVAKLGEG